MYVKHTQTSRAFIHPSIQTHGTNWPLSKRNRKSDPATKYIYIYIYIYMYICTCILVTERVCLPRRQCRVLWHSGSQISSRRFGINPEFHQLKERLPLSSAVFYFSGFLPSMPASFSLDKFVDLTGHLRGRGNRTQLAVLEVLIAVW
jgi:hypothetical protein